MVWYHVSKNMWDSYGITSGLSANPWENVDNPIGGFFNLKSGLWPKLLQKEHTPVSAHWNIGDELSYIAYFKTS